MIEDFNKRLSLLKKSDLKIFLEQLKEPCYESELLKIAFGDKDVLRVDSLELYQNHFLLFYLLYNLQEEYYGQNKYLHIHFMRTFLIDYPKIGICRHYDEYKGLFCSVKTLKNDYYCDFHFDKLNNDIEELSIKYFYYDIENFYKLDKEKAEAFINGTWEILYNYDDFKKSIKILDLPENPTLDMIKRQFKVLAKKYHPDLGEESHHKFNEINNAYRLLLKLVTKDFFPKN
ncbi:MAG TPA: DnaJ domain-containing protein [Spirochaetota bacterium]|nr:DnaJ domain-containing protein [Spirochaetota bacterium]